MTVTAPPGQLQNLSGEHTSVASANVICIAKEWMTQDRVGIILDIKKTDLSGDCRVDGHKILGISEASGKGPSQALFTSMPCSSENRIGQRRTACRVFLLSLTLKIHRVALRTCVQKLHVFVFSQVGESDLYF